MSFPKKETDIAQENDIVVNILKKNSELFTFYVQKDINTFFSALQLSNDFKQSRIIPL